MENDPITALVMKSLRNCMHQEVMRMQKILIEVHLRKPVMQEKRKITRILRKQAKVRLVTKESYCTDITNQDITTHRIWHKIYITLWVSSLDFDSFCSILQALLFWYYIIQQYENNLVRTWSALWSVTICVLFLRLCYSGISLYQQYENNHGR